MRSNSFNVLNKIRFYILAVAIPLLVGSCTKLAGWGVLLWSSENPPVPSGTVLPVYIRSNINKVWVAGIPEEYQSGEEADKFEVPLEQMEVFNSRRVAESRAAEFAPLAVSYGETLQDGLPIRDTAENSGRRVYRLRKGEVVKLLAEVEGAPAISGTGDPLPGAWYQVLTRDGTSGYCFSYRLRIFDYSGGELAVVQAQEEQADDLDLEAVLDMAWSPESYAVMLASGRIDVAQLEEHWGFFPGVEDGNARLFLKDIENDRVIDENFPYTEIVPNGPRSWRFEGSSLEMRHRDTGVLAVQYAEEGSGAMKTFLFVELPNEVDDIILQETARRGGLFSRLYAQGPSFGSANYGSLTLNRNGTFLWTGFDLLVPYIIPASAPGSGRVDTGVFLDSSLENRYAGVFTLRFGGDTAVSFLYSFENAGLRVEYVSPACFDGVTVIRREVSPTVIYFFQGGAPEDAAPAETPSIDPPPATGTGTGGFPFDNSGGLQEQPGTLFPPLETSAPASNAFPAPPETVAPPTPPPPPFPVMETPPEPALPAEDGISEGAADG